jgi:hypothetical protein
MKVLSKKEPNGMAYNLAKIDWAVFGTLTWDNDSATANSEAAEQIRQRDFNRLIWHTCNRWNLRQRNLAIYGKPEWGGGMRGHYNFLVACHGTKNTPPELLAKTMQEIWSRKHGIAKIEPFDAKRQWQGVSYQSKQEFDASGNPLWHREYISRALKAMFWKNACAATAQILTPLPNRIQPLSVEYLNAPISAGCTLL